MNLKIFKELDPSGRMSKESYLIKNYKEEYDYIINYCDLNKLIDISFKEKVYLCLNNIKEVPTCKNPNCDKKVQFRNSTLGYREYCSNKCISSDPNIKKIKEEKSFKKYGTKTPAQSNEIKEKIIKTNLEKWGGNSPMCSNEIKEKSKKTCYHNWGVDNPNKSKELIEKRIESFKKSNYRENYKKTSLERYGVENPWMDKKIHKKSIDSSIEIKNKISEKLIKEKLEKYNGYNLISIDYKPYDNLYKIECVKGHIYETTRETMKGRIRTKSEICTICNPINKSISGCEISLFNFIKENYKGEIILNNRKIIYPYEIDIYLPDLKIGFEFNGLYWHSSENRSTNYHKYKYDISIKNNIKIFNIWEDDWVYNNDIIKSIILNILGKSNKIGARKCVVKEVNKKESDIFLNENHLNGKSNSSKNIGLYYNNELYSIMTFSKNNGYYELDRYCTLKYNLIIGGASKLLKFFINNYNPKYIQTYSDNMVSDGNVYKSIGFKLIENINPTFWYLVKNKRSHRLNWRKQKLVKMGYDSNKTEEEIMAELGYYRIYNAGNKKWIYNNIYYLKDKINHD